MLTKHEFNVLVALSKKPARTQRELANALEVSTGSINKACKALTAKGFIEDGRITSAGKRVLRPCKVKNAIIMAAGTSSRFAPISYDMPKGLLKVRGEVLIERQIRQLQEAGISEIIIVVGYKAERFFYLEEQFGVKIVSNHDFASRNNNSSLMAAREYLGNSYICSSDNYYTENPFSSHERMSFYSTEFTEKHTDEWCVSGTKNNLITSVSIGGQNVWYMIGCAYFDQEFSSKYMKILQEEYNNPQTYDKLWEALYVEHIDELEMEIRRLKAGTVYEFDSLDQMRDFDPLFLENIDSDIFNNIASVLGCSKAEIRNVYPLKQGLTNLSCHFETNDGEYVYRHPGVGTDEMIDRKTEVDALTLAKSLGIDGTFIFANPEEGWKISKFIPNARELDPHDPNQVSQAMGLARTLHAQDVSLNRTFDYFTEGKKYEQLLLKKGPVTIPDYQEMADNAEKLAALTASDDTHRCLTHNDFFNLNLLYDQQGTLYLIDWEYAGMSDYACDYGTFVVTCMLDEDEADAALASYFQRTPTPQERRHNYAYVALAGWCWYIWALQKESEGGVVGEWLYIYYKYAKHYSAKALALYEQAE